MGQQIGDGSALYGWCMILEPSKCSKVRGLFGCLLILLGHRNLDP